jgi:hypothetical protein
MIVDAGLRVIETSRISGSVDKCEVLDTHFRPLRKPERRERQRRSRIAQKTQELAFGYGFMSPIDVYRVQADYYVLDGHRRVAAAKAQGIAYLDAYVKEYLDQSDKKAVEGINLRRKFEHTAQLKEPIRLDHPTGYGTLLREIAAFPQGQAPPDKAHQWFLQVFLPFTNAIRDSRLPTIYPNLRAEDIFVLIADFYHECLGGWPSQASPETMISGFLFARKLPQHRLYRSLPFRLLGAALKRLRPLGRE